jgi:hypothetical protein
MKAFNWPSMEDRKWLQQSQATLSKKWLLKEGENMQHHARFEEIINHRCPSHGSNAVFFFDVVHSFTQIIVY